MHGEKKFTQNTKRKNEEEKKMFKKHFEHLVADENAQL
jgi:hypothetical protein